MQSQSLTLDEMHDIMAFRVLVKDIYQGLLRRSWPCAFPVAPRLWALQGLHFHAQGKRLSKPAYNGHRPGRRTHRNPDSHGRHASPGRTRRCRSLALQGKRQGQQQGSRTVFLAQGNFLKDRGEETDSREFSALAENGSVQGRGLRLYPGRRCKGTAGRSYAAGLRFPDSHQGWPALRRRQDQWAPPMPLGTELKNGDIVEIVTDPARNPNRDWLKMVKTARARSRIQRYLRTEERVHAINLGREMLEKEGRKVNLNVSKAIKEGHLSLVAEDMNFDSLDDLISSVGYAHTTPRKVLNKLYAVLHPEMLYRNVAETPSVKETQRKRPANPKGLAFQGRGRRFDALCQMLQSSSRRPHYRLHKQGLSA